LISKEWRSLRRDPIVWSRLLFPLVFVGFGFYQALTNTPSGGLQDAAAISTIALYATVAYTVFFLLIRLAPPIIHREGRALHLLTLAPLSLRDVLHAEWFFCALPALVVDEGLLAASALLLRLSPGTLLLAAPAFEPGGGASGCVPTDQPDLAKARLGQSVSPGESDSESGGRDQCPAVDRWNLRTADLQRSLVSFPPRQIGRG
jgi:Putative ATP-binding cassette